MYGIVNDAIQGLVTKNFGEEAWEKIKEESGVDVDMFLTQESYPDHTTFDLAGAAAKVLNIPLSQVLHAFGEYWVLETAKRKFGALLDPGGSTLKDFLLYLPDLHNRVILLFPNLNPPEFQVSEVKENSLHLHYISERNGLTDFSVGLIHGLGKLFDTTVTVQLLQRKDEGAGHDIFLVEW